MACGQCNGHRFVHRLDSVSRPDRVAAAIVGEALQRRGRARTLLSLALTVSWLTLTVSWLALIGPFMANSHAQPTQAAQPAGYIVVLKGDPSLGPDASGRVRRVADELLAMHGGQLNRIFGSALYGFSAVLTASQRDAIAADPRVSFVEADGTMRTQQPR